MLRNVGNRQPRAHYIAETNAPLILNAKTWRRSTEPLSIAGPHRVGPAATSGGFPQRGAARADRRVDAERG